MKFSFLSVWESAGIYPALLLVIFIACATSIATYAYLWTSVQALRDANVTILNAEIAVFSSLYNLGVIFLLYFCCAFLVWAIGMRARIIIEAFGEDEEKDQKQKYLNGPLHDILAHELCRIFKLYRDVDRSSPVSAIVPVVPVTSAGVRVENVSDLLSSLATEDSVVTIGPLKVPAKIILSLFGRFFEGRRIRASLSYSNQEILLVAAISGRNSCHSWKVQRPFPPPASEEQNSQKNTPALDEKSAKGLIIREMIEELAYRIFSELTEFHSFRWEATREFMIGLERYHACLLEPREKISRLLDAEAAFMKALTEDVTFSTGWYNLGVVYTELGFTDAAKMAFYRSFEREKTRPEAFYALALNEFNTYLRDPQYGSSASPAWMEDWIHRLRDALFFCSQAELLSRKTGVIGIWPIRIPLDLLSTANPEIFLLKGRMHLELYYLTRQRAEQTAHQRSPQHKEYSYGKRSASHLSLALEAFHEAVRYTYCEWARQDFNRLQSSIVSFDFDSRSPDARAHRDHFRERVAELGWAYMECAVNQSDDYHRSSLLQTAFYIYSQGLFFDPDTTDPACLASEEAGKSKYPCPHEAVRRSPGPGWASVEETSGHLGRDLPDALYLWKCGVVCCSNDNNLLADYFLEKALLQNPRAFLFQASHILAKILNNNNQNPSEPDDYLSHAWWHTLQHAINAYNADQNGNDYQWGYVAEFSALVSRLRPSLYKQNPSSETSPDEEPEDRNRLTSLVCRCNLEESGAFGTYLLTLFSLYEIILLLSMNENDERPQEPAESADESQSPAKGARDRPGQREPFIGILKKKIFNNKYPREEINRIILDTVREELLRKVRYNPTIHPGTVLGYLEHHTEWVLGQCYLTLGRHMIRDGSEPEMTRIVFSYAEEYLGRYGLEPGFRALYANESMVESQLNDPLGALSRAWQAHWKDPTGTYEHIQLGLCQFSIQDFTSAETSFMDADLWGLENLGQIAEISMSRAASYSSRTNDYPVADPEEDGNMRTACLKKALASLQRSLRFTEYGFQKGLSDPFKKKTDPARDPGIRSLLPIYFWTGCIHIQLADYPHAIENFRIIKNLTVPGNLKSRPIPKNLIREDFERFSISSYLLGKTYLEYGRIIEAENEFLSLISLICDEPRRRDYSLSPGGDFTIILKSLYDIRYGGTLLVSGLSVKKILFDSYLSLAKVYCLRLCTREKIVEALTEARRVAAVNGFECIPDMTRQIPMAVVYASGIEKIRGFAYLQSCNSPERAIRHLKDAIGLYADPEAYVFLLFALGHLQKTLPEPKRPECILELKNTYSVLKKMGIPAEYSEEVTAVVTEMAGPTNPAPQKAGGKPAEAG